MTQGTSKRYTDSVRARVRHLRTKGAPIKQLAKLVGASPATIAYWTHDIRLTAEQNAVNKLHTLPNPAQGARARHDQSSARRSKWRLEAKEHFNQLILEPLFVLGLGLYWGEGDKANPNDFKLTNSDPALARVWLRWCSTYAPDLPIRLQLWLHPEVPKDFAVRYWLKELQYPSSTELLCIVKKGTLTSHVGSISMGTIKIIGGIGATEMRTKMGQWLEMSADRSSVISRPVRLVD